MGAPMLPPRFPCWCQATYSWGGETKKDLGFVEGDLIEALNAGDGSWWMGRLRRDPRAIGLFPSNFVRILDESFQPAPMSRNPSPAIPAKASPSPTKTKSVFRRPFDAYEKVGGSPGGTRESTPDSDREKQRKEKSKFRPYSSMKTAQAQSPVPKRPIQQQEGPRIPAPPPRGHSRRPSRAPSASPTPTPGFSRPAAASMYRAASPQPGYHAPSPMPSRSPSPLPQTYHDGSAYPQLLPSSRGPSPNPYQQQQQDNYYGSRAPSPAPSFGYQPSYRAPSPQPYEEDIPSSPPPPPPPAHRVAYKPSRAPSPVNGYQQDYHDRTMSRTPVPPSPSGDGGSHMTPSPLRDAMNDVMSSLHDMSMYGDTSEMQENVPSHQALTSRTIWSPEEFDLTRTRSQQQQHSRAKSSLGFSEDHGYDGSLPPSRDGAPELGDYVQRMEHQLRHVQSTISHTSTGPPAPPLKGSQYAPNRSRPTTAGSSSSHSSSDRGMHSQRSNPPALKHQRSAYELGRERLNRTYTTKTNVTNSTESSSATQSSTSTAMTSRSIMSGYSAGGFSATSAGSLARRKFSLSSQRGQRPKSSYEVRQAGDTNSSSRSNAASEVSAGSGPSYHESHASGNQPLPTPTADWTKDPMESAGILGGLSAPKAARKSGFFKKMIENAKTSARTGAATARSTLGSASGSRPGSRAGSPTKSLMAGMGPTVVTPGIGSRPDSAFGGGNAARDMGLGGGGEWMQVRRDINRSNSLSRREREERIERSEMLGLPAMNPIDELHEMTEGDEGLDGLCISDPSDFHTTTLTLVDKSTRFIQSIPPMVSAAALAQNYICRPHRSDVQRLRAIFTWVSERFTWEEDYEGEVDTRRAISSKRGSSQEIALLVREMCTAVGLYAEEIHGYLKAPGEILDLDTVQHANHWWNAVIVDGEWRIMDCSLANPTNPRRSAYTSASAQVAESWYFLARPSHICYTHIPLLMEQQHIVPPVDVEVLINLPCATPAYHKHELELADFNTSALYLENLEMTQIHVTVPDDVECVAETEARAFAQDADGDCFESGDVTVKKAFAQAEWCAGRKRFTIKAVLPSDEGQATLKIYAGKRGLMHSAKDNPHALALALPLTHTGQNPVYDFHIRHPTPHAQRHDLYVVQPQCGKLTLNNTFVFCIRQHPSSLSRFTPDTWGTNTTGRPSSPSNIQPFARPGSAMSMVSAFSASVSQTGSNSDYSSSSSASNNNNQQVGGGMTPAQSKPAKLAIQTPSQKIIRLTRKMEHVSRSGGGEDDGLTTSWETVIKIGERGIWRGLVLADRSARWCVFGEWECA